MKHHSHHSHSHSHHSGSAGGTSFSAPTREVKDAVISGLRAAETDQSRALSAIDPLAASSPEIHTLCRKLIEAGNVPRALKLIEEVPTRNQGAWLLVSIVIAILVLGAGIPIFIFVLRR